MREVIFPTVVLVLRVSAGEGNALTWAFLFRRLPLEGTGGSLFSLPAGLPPENALFVPKMRISIEKYALPVGFLTEKMWLPIKKIYTQKNPFSS